MVYDLDKSNGNDDMGTSKWILLSEPSPRTRKAGGGLFDEWIHVHT